MVRALCTIAFWAVTTLSKSVFQWAPSAGTPPLKWYRFDHWRVAPLNGICVVILTEGVSAIVATHYVRSRTDVAGPCVGAQAIAPIGPSAAINPPPLRSGAQRALGWVEPPCTVRLGSSIPDRRFSPPD